MSDLALFTEIARHIQRCFDDPEAKGKLISDAVDFFLLVISPFEPLGQHSGRVAWQKLARNSCIGRLFRCMGEIFWLVPKDEEPIKKLIIDTITLYVTSVNKKPVLV